MSELAPVDQTLFGVPEGNCAVACLATILGLRLKDVPHFCRDVPLDQDWQRATNQWLAQRGLVALTLDIPPDGAMPPMNALVDGIPCIVSGKSPRGDFTHCIVARYRLDEEGHWLQYMHDPHPDRTWLRKATSVDFFISVCPASIAGSKPKEPTRG